MAKPATEVPRVSPARAPSVLQRPDHYRVEYMHWVPPGTTVEDVIEPTFWKHVAKKLNRADIIEVMSQDLTWRAVLIVRATSGPEAIVQVISYDDLGAPPAIELSASPYRVDFVNSARNWGVFRRDNGEKLRDEFPSREAAERYAMNHTKLLSA